MRLGAALQALTSAGIEPPPFDELPDLVKRFDEDGDGRVTLKEMKALIDWLSRASSGDSPIAADQLRINDVDVAVASGSEPTATDAAPATTASHSPSQPPSTAADTSPSSSPSQLEYASNYSTSTATADAAVVPSARAAPSGGAAPLEAEPPSPLPALLPAVDPVEAALPAASTAASEPLSEAMLATAAAQPEPSERVPLSSLPPHKPPASTELPTPPLQQQPSPLAPPPLAQQPTPHEPPPLAAPATSYPVTVAGASSDGPEAAATAAAEALPPGWESVQDDLGGTGEANP